MLPSTVVCAKMRHVTLMLGCCYVTSLMALIHHIPLKRTRPWIEQDLAAVVDDEQSGDDNNLMGTPGEGYYIEVSIGNPPQQLNVLVDTGSSNFAVAASPHQYLNMYYNYSISSTFQTENTTVTLLYTQGHWSGILGRDLVTIPVLLEHPVNVNIACIQQSQQFFINGSHWQGILGLAYSAIAKPDSGLQTFFTSVVEQLNIDDVFGLQLCAPLDSEELVDVSMGGMLILGSLDDTLYTGDMRYAQIHKEWYYEVLIVDMSVNQTSLAMHCDEYNFDKTIIDSGTTNFRLPPKIFEAVVKQIRLDIKPFLVVPPSEFWHRGEKICWPVGGLEWSQWPYVVLELQSTDNSTFKLHISPQQYLRAVPNPNKDCYKFAITASNSGTVLGAVVMEGFYVHFDRQNSRVGFAKSTCATRSNQMTSHITGPYYMKGDMSQCVYTPIVKKKSSLHSVIIVLGCLCAVCFLIASGYFLLLFVKRRAEQNGTTSRSHIEHSRLHNDIDALLNGEPLDR